MQRAANDVMQSILFSAVLDAVAALKSASGGLPNQLLRDVQAIHPNMTFADLPKALQDAIANSTRTAFTQLLKEAMQSARASRCRCNARWTAFPSAIAAFLRTAVRFVTARAAAARGLRAMGLGLAVPVVRRARASLRRASPGSPRGWRAFPCVRGRDHGQYAHQDASGADRRAVKPMPALKRETVSPSQCRASIRAVRATPTV